MSNSTEREATYAKARRMLLSACLLDEGAIPIPAEYVRFPSKGVPENLRRDEASPKGQVAFELPQDALSALALPGEATDGSFEVSHAISKLGYTGKGRTGTLVKDSRKVGIFVTVEEGVFRKIADRALEAILDPPRGSALLGFSEDELCHQLATPGSEAFKLAQKLTHDAHLNSETVKPFCAAAAKGDYMELAAALRDTAAAYKPKASPAAPAVDLDDVVPPAVSHDARIARTARLLLATKPLGRDNPPSIHINHVSTTTTTRSGIKDTREFFSDCNYVALELRQTALDKVANPQKGDINGAVLHVLQQLGAYGEDVEFSYLMKGDQVQGLRVLIQKDAYAEAAQRVVRDMLKPETGARLLNMEQGEYNAALVQTGSEPNRIFMNMVAQAGYNLGELKEVMFEAAQADKHELATGIRDMIKAKMTAMGRPQGKREQGG